jgi:hypothetical protein
MGVYVPNFNTMELANFLEKILRLQHQIQAVTLKIISCRFMHNFFIKKKVKIQDFMGKTIYFFGTLPFSPWVVLATWLHLGASQKLHEK